MAGNEAPRGRLLVVHLVFYAVAFLVFFLLIFVSLARRSHYLTPLNLIGVNVADGQTSCERISAVLVLAASDRVQCGNGYQTQYADSLCPGHHPDPSICPALHPGLPKQHLHSDLPLSGQLTLIFALSSYVLAACSPVRRT